MSPALAPRRPVEARLGRLGTMGAPRQGKAV